MITLNTIIISPKIEVFSTILYFLFLTECNIIGPECYWKFCFSFLNKIDFLENTRRQNLRLSNTKLNFNIKVGSYFTSVFINQLNRRPEMDVFDYFKLEIGNERVINSTMGLTQRNEHKKITVRYFELQYPSMTPDKNLYLVITKLIVILILSISCIDAFEDCVISEI